ncbi:MAG: FAD-dependent oxidoreductase [Acetobacteraceae bacterium]|nr:FAD-dependent oxidoreductase [Acetobacteraceae bacterium]
MHGPIHIIGGGLAGLSAALALAGAGRRVSLYEAGPQAGGRCRSYDDALLGCRVDNGNHLILSGNRATFAYMDAIGARATLDGPGEPYFPFLDRSTGERWVLRPSAGRVPWWIFRASRRVPGTRASEYLDLIRLRKAAGTVAEAFGRGPLYRRLIEPLAVAALNTRPEHGAAALLAAVVKETLMQGGHACIPSFPRRSLAESLIDPAIATLRAQGADVSLGRRIAGLQIEAGRVKALNTPDGPVSLGNGEAVILAVPPWVARDMVPGIGAPDSHESILNIHFRIEADRGRAGFIGIIGGTAEWVFVKPGHVSVTISAANRMVDQPAEAIAQAVWPDARAALMLPEAAPMPAWRVVKEKRATFAATAEQDRKRPAARTPVANLVLAGDWTATGLPATIEGAIRSGRTAAGVALGA